MKITIPGCKPLVLPEDIIRPEEGPFNGKTSYASKLVTRLKQKSYREKKLPLKLACLQVLQERAVELARYKTYFEPLAGVGLSARLFQPEMAWMNDLDEGCRQVMAANKFDVITGEDAEIMLYPKADLIFLDFNDFTFKRYLNNYWAAAVAGAFKRAQKFVIINDCSPFYFRYGQEAFARYAQLLGSPIGSVEDYLLAARSRLAKEYDGWWMTHAAYFNESSFQLFYKGVSPFIMTKVTQGLPVQISEGFLS